MSMQFNTGPYFDDFDPANNFYRVLFKPGYAVQARELNQLQSILQHQISSTANHLFQKNSIVIPGGTVLNTAADILSIEGVGDPSVLVGQTITNASSFDFTDDSTLQDFITAVILGYRLPSETEPAALYIKYFKSGVENNVIRTKFNAGETLRTVGPTLLTFNVHPTFGASIGKVATISEGTFYTKEIFVDCRSQSVIIERDRETLTNCIVGLQITETIVTSDDDESLLDNANGAPNQYAPGADRYKIDLILTRVDINTPIDDDKFIKLMVVESDVVTYLNNTTQYAELMKTLARRTYDANGNFIVRGLNTSVVQSALEDTVQFNVSAGKCYLGGYEYNQISMRSIPVTKPRDENYQVQMPDVNTYTSGMTFMYTAGGAYAKEIPDNNTLVQFLDAEPESDSPRVIGYGVFKYMQYYSGTIGSTDVYKMFFDYISIEKGYDISDVGGVRVVSAEEGVAVLHQLRVSNVTGTFDVGNTLQSTTELLQTGLIYAVSPGNIYVIKTTSNPVPNTDTVRDGTTEANATRRSTFVSNYTNNFIPMIRVDSDTIKTLYKNNEPSLSYSYVRKDVFTFPEEGDYEILTSLGENDTFEDFSSADYFAFVVTPGSEGFVDLGDGALQIIESGKKYRITIGSGSPLIGTTAWVYSTINSTKIAEAPKAVPPPVTIQIATPSKSWMALGHQDVTEVIKVVDGKTYVVNNGVYDGDAYTMTYTATAAHGLSVGNTVVVTNMASVENPTGAFNSGYNGRFVVSSIPVDEETELPSTTKFTVTVGEAYIDPGTFSSSGIVAVPANINTDVDITSRYYFDTGSTANNHGTGLIKLKKNATQPSGQIAVQYRYYSTGNGGYVSVDSYQTGEDLSYIGRIRDIYDSRKQPISVRNYIDFRSTTSKYFFKNIGSILAGSKVLVLKDLNLSALQSDLTSTLSVKRYVVGPSHDNSQVEIETIKFNPATGNTEVHLVDTAPTSASGIFYIGLNGATLSLADTTAGAKVFAFPKDSTRISYSYVKFKPKQVMVFVNRTTDVLEVTSEEVNSISDVFAVRRNEFKLPLAYMYMKPYTVTLSDVEITRFDNPVYQMLDIHNIKQRVDRTEYYTSLALGQDIERAIIDANNENFDQSSRGFWNENFMSSSTQDTQSDDFQCTVYDRSYAAPGTVTRTISLQVASDNSTTWQQTGTNITLPYTEVRAFGNDLSSRSNNLNPFNVINWSGKLSLNPSIDNWIDTTLAPTITSINTISVAPSVTVNNITEVTNVTNVTNTTEIVNVTNVTEVTNITNTTIITEPPPVLPPPPIEEIITEVDVISARWGPDSRGGSHSITFTWRTNTGRTGRVNTDSHLAPMLTSIGGNPNGIDGTYAKSLINKPYNSTGAKEYLHVGTHFDQKSPSNW